jgi:hypothetical protein
MFYNGLNPAMKHGKPFFLPVLNTSILSSSSSCKISLVCWLYLPLLVHCGHKCRTRHFVFFVPFVVCSWILFLFFGKIYLLFSNSFVRVFFQSYVLSSPIRFVFYPKSCVVCVSEVMFIFFESYAECFPKSGIISDNFVFFLRKVLFFLNGIFTVCFVLPTQRGSSIRIWTCTIRRHVFG